MDLVLGIDPGAAGAMVALDLAGGYVHSGMLPRTSGKKPANDVAGTARIIREVSERSRIVRVGVELVGHVAGNSAGSSMKLVAHAGELRGMAYALGLEVVKIRPQSWQLGLGLPAGMESRQVRLRKQALAILAAARWPALAPRLALVKHYGQADAAWIASATLERYLLEELSSVLPRWSPPSRAALEVAELVRQAAAIVPSPRKPRTRPGRRPRSGVAATAEPGSPDVPF